ncbi:MAG: NifB/NifX family molybdenum-iron cluster-binding protein, partial [Desulfovibrionaceae bacterium]|nr:NifB/NifX family molybdenum-iron cluster-binding protein [Desulfovibrionaceae bacterium]
MSTLIAVPSCLPGGLDAAMGMHFGKCDIFTLVEIEGTDIISVQALPNAPHEHGGCLAPVEILASQGVKALIAGGMGMCPLMGFAQA